MNKNAKSEPITLKKRVASFLKIVIFILLAIDSELIFIYTNVPPISAVVGCSIMATFTEGYSAWKYENTERWILSASVNFTDGFNTLSCGAVGMGLLWVPIGQGQTLIGCGRLIGEDQIFEDAECPRGYYGVRP